MHEVGLAAEAERRKAAVAQQASSQPSARRALVGCALLLCLSAASQAQGPTVPLLATLTAFVQAAWPLWHRQQVETGDVVYHSFGAQWRQEVRDAAWLALIVLPPWLALAAWWFAPAGVFSAADGPLRLFARALGLFVIQWLTVAAPEEWFWRGYVQPALVARGRPKALQSGAQGANALLEQPTPWRAWLPLGAIVSTALFALLHLVRQPTAAALATFVPGLLFAKLYTRRGRVLGASLLHAACNAASAMLLG